MDIESRKRVIVGLNQFNEKERVSPPMLEIDPRIEQDQTTRLKRFRAGRDQAAAETSRAALERAAREETNLVPKILDCVKSKVTLGEIVQSLEKTYGRYRP